MCWPVYCITVDRIGVEIPLDVMLSSLGYGAALLCSSAGGGRKCAEAGGVVDLRGCSRESCVVYPRSTQVQWNFYTSSIDNNPINRPTQTTQLCRQAKKTFSTPPQQPPTQPPLQHREPAHHHASDKTYTCCSLIPAPPPILTPPTCPQRVHTYAPPLLLFLSLLLYILYSTLHK